MATLQRIYSITTGTPFLPALADSLVRGELIEGFEPLRDPMALVRATVYLPTRRAARAFGEAILQATGRPAALLPAILTLGDDDDAEFRSTEQAGEEIAAAVNSTERQLYLSLLVQKFAAAFALESREFDSCGLVLPTGTAEAAHLAGELARLLDQLATEEISWSQMEKFARMESGDAPWAAWWTLSLRFLSIVGEHWPEHLAEIGRLDPAVRRRALLDARTRHYRENGAAGPVIAAGSTGSIPATARLLRAISQLDDGAVVLPGVDRNLDERIFRQLADRKACAEMPALSAHPQAGLAQLIAELGTRPGEIAQIGAGSAAPAQRMSLVSRAMLPAQWTAAWLDVDAEAACEALEGICLIEAANENEEALALAVAMRECLQTKGKTVALVTPDRNLARRVVSELARFGIEIDSSAGVPLTATPAFDFVRVLLDIVFGNAGPADYAALVKHPYLRGEGGSGRIGRLFELAVLRDSLRVPRPGLFCDAAERARRRIMRSRHVAAPLRNLSGSQWQAIADLGHAVDHALEPLAVLAGSAEPVGVAAAATGLLDSIARITGSSPDHPFHADSAGEAICQLLRRVSATPGANLSMDTREIAGVLFALAADVTVRSHKEGHSRLFIWGTLEARLQHVDRILLGGLNEGTWPAAGRNDPFLNRPMKAGIGLTLPERRIGQAAHDFQQLSGSAEVVYSRSQRTENAPTIPSRWLQRLAAAAGPKAAGQMRERGQRYIDLASRLDAGEGSASRADRPCPKPPARLRPGGLSITEIEAWIRDPYAIYARHVLELVPLPPLIRTADPLLRGTLYHAVLDRFVREGGASFERLENTTFAVFEKFDLPADVTASWMPRFLSIGRRFVQWETERRPRIAESVTEVRGKTRVGETGFELRGRADRIDVMKDGSLAIFDYKTGGTPSLKQARTLSPQLALEAGMAIAGAFAIPAGRPVSELAYVRLRPGGKWKVEDLCQDREVSNPAELARDAFRQLHELVIAFASDDQGYISRRAPMRESDLSGDYDHLARVREWMVGEDDPDGDD